jgi:uncharacterized protein YbbC (DUF1343 family)
MKHFFITALLATFFACGSQMYQPQSAVANTILCGAEQTEEYIDLLKNKRVGVIANQTSRIGNTHLVDTLAALGIQVATVFAPEHGFRGEAGAGEHIKDGKDPKTGIPVLSLYGKTKKPTAEMLKGIDLLVFDIQDVGARFYTYISTLHYVLEAAAENNIEVLVLDRPNPNGYYVDGPVREEKYASFVGMHAIPIVHGLTVGELTRMILGEGWLKTNPVVHIIPCKNYTHSMRYSLPVKPSPNLPNDRAIELYPSLCWFEGTEVSVGRGTPYPFQIIGFPNCTAGTFTFTPVDMPGIANDPPHENKLCKGLDLRTTANSSGETSTGIHIEWLLSMYSSYPNPSTFFYANGFFDKLCGTASVREMVIAGKTAKEIRASWQEDLIAYKKKRNTYLLYPDFE